MMAVKRVDLDIAQAASTQATEMPAIGPPFFSPPRPRFWAEGGNLAWNWAECLFVARGRRREFDFSEGVTRG